MAWLIENGITPDVLSLQYAIKKNKLDCVLALLPNFPHKLELSTKTLSPLLEAVLFGKFEIFQVLYEDFNIKKNLDSSEFEKIFFLCMHIENPELWKYLMVAATDPDLKELSFQGLTFPELVPLISNPTIKQLLTTEINQKTPEHLESFTFMETMMTKIHKISFYDFLNYKFDVKNLENYFKGEQTEFQGSKEQNLFLKNSFEGCLTTSNGRREKGDPWNLELFLKCEAWIKGDSVRASQTRCLRVHSDDVELVPTLIGSVGDSKPVIFDFRVYLEEYRHTAHDIDKQRQLRDKISRDLAQLARYPKETIIFLLNPDLLWDWYWINYNRELLETGEHTTCHDLWIPNELDSLVYCKLRTFICVKNSGRFCPRADRRIHQDLSCTVSADQHHLLVSYLLQLVSLPSSIMEHLKPKLANHQNLNTPCISQLFGPGLDSSWEDTLLALIPADLSPLMTRYCNHELLYSAGDLFKIVLMIKYYSIHCPSLSIGGIISKSISIINFVNLRQNYSDIICNPKPKPSESPQSPPTTMNWCGFSTVELGDSDIDNLYS